MTMFMLDMDQYKATALQFILDHGYGELPSTYKFINRRSDDKFDHNFLATLNEAIYWQSLQSYSESDIYYLSSMGIFKEWFLTWLRSFHYNPFIVHTGITDDNNLSIEIKGKWQETLPWEVTLLKLISEIYFKFKRASPEENEERLRLKADQMKGLPFCEFGTRRRRSFDFQSQAVKIFSSYSNFIGTSNPYLAKKYGTGCVGTFGHEVVMGCSAIEGLQRANYHTLKKWQHTYKGKLGIALTDTFGTNNFLKCFDGELARAFDGVRQDSGDPVEFARKMVEHYHRLGINPKSKRILFSDNLNPEKCREIDNAIGGGETIGRTYCIGTNFTNDVPGSKALNIVIKLHELNHVPVIKLSDDIGKACGEQWVIDYATKLFGGPAVP